MIKSYTLLAVLIGLFSLGTQAQKLSKVETAAANILVVNLESDYINIKQANRTTVYNDFKPSMLNWLVNGISPLDVSIYSGVIDEKKAFVVNSETFFPIKMRHKVYLIMPNNLIENQSYAITSAYGNYSFIFHQNSMYCESIKVNQVGYALNSSVRYANFGIYMGDGGSIPLPSLGTYVVKDALSNTTVFTGSLSYWGDDTGNGTTKSGEFVYRIDLSSLILGKYYIELPGIGRSYTFGVGDDYSREIANTHARGMYHQRCGIALESPYTLFNRTICHHQVAHTEFIGNGGEGEGWINVLKGTKMFEIAGGYHDAGDFDRRVYHTIIPLLMLNYYEAFEDHFIDGQYNIPESGNGIPDFLDEALWGVKIWEELQLDESNFADPSKFGGVMGGTETSSHPTYGKDRADWEKNGTQVYGTYAIYESTTYAAAGFFAQAARLLAPYNPRRAAKLLQRAVLAWDYCSKQGFDTQKGFKMYAALQLYLATAVGQPKEDMYNVYHLIFKQLATTYVVNGGLWPYQYLPGNSASKITTAHFISYLLSPALKDQALADNLTAVIKTAADNGGYMGWKPALYPYAQGATKFVGFGAATAQGRYADPAAFMYRLSTNPDEKKAYYSIVSQLGDYSLGLNPLNQSFVTGLGSQQVQSPLHLDSYWTKYGETPQGGKQLVRGNIPGLVVYGATETRSNADYQTAVSDYVYPAWDNLPGQRRWTDGWSLVNSNEFTTWETLVWNTCMYAVLYNAQKDPSIPSMPIPRAGKISIYPNPTDNLINILGEFGTSRYSCTIYDAIGRKVKRLINLSAINDTNKLVIPDLADLNTGVYVIYLTDNNKVFKGKFIKD